MTFEPRSLVRLRYWPSLVSVLGLGIPVFLYPVLLDSWLRRAGEANFVFFQCLAYEAMLSVLLLEYVSACLVRDKCLRLTLKERKKA